MKKRKGSKWISFLMAAALVFSMSGMTALASAPDEGDWTDLNEYVEETGTGLEEGQYYLSDRLDLEESLTLEEDADVVLDLCGSTLVGPEDGDSVIVVDASESILTIQDSEEDGAITSYGYGLEIYDGTVALNGGSIQSCVWGGVYIVGEDALFLMNDGDISNNTADSDMGLGGGVFIGPDGSFCMLGGTIAENEADLGGGVANWGGTFVMEENAVISGNHSEVAGGGVANTYDVEDEFEGGTFYLNGGTIEDNTAEEDGGGIWNSGIFQMDGGTVQDNTAGEYGGGIRLMTDEDNPIPSETDSFEMSDGEILNNTAESASGGGVALGSEDDSAGAAFTMSGGTIQGNEAAADGAGGVYVGPDCDFLMTGGTIAENEAYVGGGVGNEAGSFAMDEDAVISGNTAEQAGGVANAGGEFVMGGGRITENTATYGGGVITYSYDDGEAHEATFFLSGGSIEENTAESYGGVYVDTGDDSFAVSGDATVKGNTATGEDNNVCLPEGTHIRLLGELTGDIYVTVENAEEESTYGRQITEEEEDTEWYETAMDHFWPDVTFVADQMVVSSANDAGYVEFILEDYGTIDYRFVNPEKEGPTAEEISAAGLDLPEVERFPYAEGETVTATISGQAEDLIGSVVQGTVNGDPCIWTLTGWSPGEIELNSENPAGIFDGMWEFTLDVKDGLIKDSDGVWRLYKDGVFQRDYTGFAENANGKWYVKHGVVAFDTTDILKDKTGAIGDADEWYYVIDSKVQTGFTGLSNFSNQYGWWYIKDGKVDFSRNSVDKNKNGWWYVVGGKVQFGFTGLANYKNENGWWYIQNGAVNFNHNGVDKNKNGWYYVVGGKVQFDFTGLANYRNDNGWWYISGGKVMFNHTGVEKNQNGWWYVKDSKVRFDFDGIASNKNGSWYITDGKVRFSYSGTVTYDGKRYTIRNGKVS